MTEPTILRGREREAARRRPPPAPRPAEVGDAAGRLPDHARARPLDTPADGRPVMTGVAGAGIWALARAMLMLARVSSAGLEDVLRLKRAGRRILLVSWHGYDLCNLGVYRQLYGRSSRVVLMVPATREGWVMERMASRFGYEAIRIGVDPRSPASARGVVEMVARIKDGCDGMIAVDGPFGPPEQAKLGAAVIAKRAGAVVVPTVVAGSREIRMRSRWDRHLLIPPFARMLVHFGPLIDPAPAEGAAPSTEQMRSLIETALHRSTERACAMIHGLPTDA